MNGATASFLMALALAATPAPVPKGDAGLEPAQRTMLDLRVIAAVFSGYSDDGRALPDLGPAFVSGRQVADAIGATPASLIRKILTAPDGWGNSYQFVLLGSHYLVLSFGVDGKADLPYAEVLAGKRADPPDLSTYEHKADVPERDIVLADGELEQRPERKHPPAVNAMIDIRSIATAVESFAVDNNLYPGPVTELRPVEVLRHDVEPTYIKSLPLIDPWGHPYLVWSDTKGYFILSQGSDGILDRNYVASDGTRLSPMPSAQTNAEEADIVFSDGQFIQYPAGEMH